MVESNSKIGFQIFAVAIIIVLVNFIGSYKFFRADLTEEKIHSLSPTTINILENDSIFTDELRFEIYLQGDLPPEFRKLQLAIKEKLNEFRAYAGSKIYYEFIDPAKDESSKTQVYKQLYDFGLRPTLVTTYNGGTKKDMLVFGGILIRTPQNKNIPIQLIPGSIIDPNSHRAIPVSIDRIPVGKSIKDLEYLLLEGVYKALSPNRKKIGFVQGHGELTEAQRHDVTVELQKFHEVENVKIGGNIKALNNFDAIVIAKPTLPFTEKDKYLIDQFIMNGGKVAWLIDPVKINLDSLKINQQTMGLKRDLNDIDQLLFTYGVRLNNDLVIDVDAHKLFLGGKLYKWYYFPLINSWRIKHPIMNNLNPIRLQYASTLELLKTPEITKIPLLVTSEKSVTYKVPVRVNYQMIGLKEDIVKHNANPNRIIATMLKGKFKSNFKNRLTTHFIKNSPIKHRDKGIENKMLVISDGDIIRAEVDSMKSYKGVMQYMTRNVNYDRYDRSIIFGNKEFFVNAMEDLMGISDLIPLRSKTITLRPLNKGKVKKERSFWQAINVLVPVLLILFFGLIYNIFRKRRFTK